MATVKIASITALCSLVALQTMGCGDPETQDPTDQPAEIEQEDKDDALEAPTTRLQGQLLDTDDQPVSGAIVRVAVGSVPITGETVTDADGGYAIDVPTAEVKWAWSQNQEVTVLFDTPKVDEGAAGAQGDLVHLLPATLDELLDVETFEAGAEFTVKTAFVPRQGKGFAITDALIADGGTLTWRSDDSQYGEDFAVSLIIEPGSIHRGPDAQDEITLTLIEQAKAPMSIPEDGFGPMWTIQPRDIVFDPPARLRIEGNEFAVMGPSDLQLGDITELYGASLETGWKLFGDIQINERTDDGRVVMETPTGVISHGAWGHVFNNTDNDYGMLVECFSQNTGARVQCAVLNDNAYWYQDPNNFNQWNITNLCEQPDFVPPTGVGGGYDDGFLACDQWDYGTSTTDGNHMVYPSDGETRCAGCGGANSSTVVALSAKNPVGTTNEPIWGGVAAFPLCPEEQSSSDAEALWDTLYQRIGLDWGDGTILPFEDGAVSTELEVELGWRNFSKSVQIYLPDPVNCTTAG